MFFDETVTKARYFAIDIHSGQKYDEHPYIKHLEDVFKVLERYKVKHQAILVASFLHDILEDGAASYQDVKKIFGFEVAEIVYAVTDELGRNRKERHENTYPKIKESLFAICLKLADMIANVEYGQSQNARSNLLSMYIREYPNFRSYMFHADLEDNAGLKECVYEMWEHLDDLLEYKKEK